jgi:DNA-directed RNA polymerase specialized sigma24 family protein
MHAMEDLDIVTAIVRRNQAGLEAALDKYGDAIYGYCRYLIADPVAAEDAVRDTFLVAWARADVLRRPDQFRSWLDAVACNECLRGMDSAARQAIADRAGGQGSSELIRDSELEDLLRAAVSGGGDGRAALETILVSLPCSVRDGVLRLASDQQRGATLYRFHVADRAEPFSADGFPVPIPAEDEPFPVPLAAPVPLGTLIEDAPAPAGDGETDRTDVGWVISGQAPEPAIDRPANDRPANDRPAVADRDGGGRHAARAVAPPRRRNPALTAFLTAGVVLLAGESGVAAWVLAHGPVSQPVADRLSAPAGISPSVLPAPTPTPTPAGHSARPGLHPARPGGRAFASVPIRLPVLPPAPVISRPVRRHPRPAPSPSASVPAPGGLTPAGLVLEMEPAPAPPGDVGPPAFDGTFTLTATNGPVTFTITGTPGLDISPAKLSLAAGQAVTITVQTDEINPPSSLTGNIITVDPGNIAILVEYPPPAS